MFPNNVIESVRETFETAENSFRQQAVQNGKLVDKSGSCALISLIVNNMLYAINLGDSRALYSRDGGKEYYQITRDHKPNDPKE
jgi:serine/threonine protein phosphatase PrpC